MSDASSNLRTLQRYLPTLDGWRAVAIFLVILDHGGDPLLHGVLALAGHGTGFSSLSYESLKDPIGRGGVHLFFALSGYLITWRLLQEEAARGGVSLSDFYIRRLFRIQPAALTYLAVIGVLGLAGVLLVSASGWRAALLGYANLSMGSQTWYTTHFWSLAVEEHFYLLWPLAFLLLGPRRRLVGTLVLAGLLALWLWIVVRYHVAYSPYMWVRSDLEGNWLIWGCVAALAQGSGTGRRVLELLTRPGVGLSALVFGVCSVLFSGRDAKLVCALTVLAAAATPLLLLGTVRRPSSWFARLLESRPLRTLGRISYGLYLWQQLFFVWDPYRSATLAPLQSPPWRLPLALGCALLSYTLLERPLLGCSARLLARRRARAAACESHAPWRTLLVLLHIPAGQRRRR
jgi:peptidoglycan/LPS O-acetylase OafA/YrhL